MRMRERVTIICAMLLMTVQVHANTVDSVVEEEFLELSDSTEHGDESTEYDASPLNMVEMTRIKSDVFARWMRNQIEHIPDEVNHLMLAEEVDDAEDRGKAQKRNSRNQNRLIGDGRLTKKGDHGEIRPVGHIGYTSKGAYTGKRGHYYIGASRRRIGAGFGRRRANKIVVPPVDYGEIIDPFSRRRKKIADDGLDEHHRLRKSGCRKYANGATTTLIEGIVTDVGSQDTSGQHSVPVEGMEITWVNSVTGIKKSAMTDNTGRYTLKLQRCQYYTMQMKKSGFVDDSGEGACVDPYLLLDAKEIWSSSTSQILPKSQLRFTLTWKVLKRGARPGDSPSNGPAYTKDLNLHLLFPGARDVMMPKFVDSKYSKEKMNHLAAEILNGTVATKQSFKATDIGKHPSQNEVVEEGGLNNFDGDHHIYWEDVGSRTEEPLVQYQSYTSKGPRSSSASTSAGGPESIVALDVLRNTHKMFLLYVECFSCDQYESDESSHTGSRPLTFTALSEFMQSEATVKIYEGAKQTFCKSVSSAQGKAPHTRWDVGVITCGPEAKMTGLCTVHDVHEFNELSPGCGIEEKGHCKPSPQQLLDSAQPRYEHARTHNISSAEIANSSSKIQKKSEKYDAAAKDTM